MTDNLSFKSLGLCDYEDSFLMMKSQIKDEDFKNEIWFLEHPSVFTLGTAADKKHILDSKDIPVVQSDRGLCLTEQLECLLSPIYVFYQLLFQG